MEAKVLSNFHATLRWIGGLRLEVIIFRKDFRTYQFFLQDLHKIEQILRMVVTYII